MSLTVSVILTAAALSAEVVLGAFLRAYDRSSCSPLKNHGAFSTVEVLVGTPAQKFDLVADTGSNDVIVQSCICQESGFCPKEFGKCFRGTNKSTSFVMHHQDQGDANKLRGMLLSFGSGQIMALPATDMVQVGNQRATMDESLLLMVKQALQMSGQFEGILGLGRPQRGGQNKTLGEVPGFLEKAKVDRFSMCFKEKGDGVLDLNTLPTKGAMGSVGALHWGVDFQGVSVGSAEHKVLFCSPDSKKQGQQTACGFIPDSGTTLMMGPEKQILSLYDDLCSRWDRCKKTHEGLVKELKKLREESNQSVSQENNPLYLLQNGQDPSGASGWADVLKKLRGILGGGGTEGGNADPFGIDDQGYGGGDASSESLTSFTRAETLQLLLENCEQWMGKNMSFNTEMPSLFFHAAGTRGTGKQVLEMQAETYILKSTQEVVHKEIKKLMGVLPVQVLEKKNSTVCMPAFGKMDYPTQLNGDVWIFGTPLFYQFNVHYDRSADPPTMTFVQEDCGECQAGKRVGKSAAALLSSGTDSSGLAGLRQLSGAPVVGNYDTSLPM
eukprot:TRINITY_DN45141_c0_g1_i1.p1 TRINITY_DN45141_c0_g1~~TRINITY_DN45141_c0_g1_i1.p1  ORF type:complete len:554 (-),score=115.76 TRINITY_DN45141_c0_g1_i1:63-1724(-)